MAKFKDLTGQKFGKLTVIKRVENHILPCGNSICRYLCQCECVNTIEVNRNNLTQGYIKSCGCLKIKDLTGQKFGKLTVIKCVGKNKQHNLLWLCQCECGNLKVTSSSNLIREHTKSCGCLQHTRTITKEEDKLAKVLYGIRERCNNPNHKEYKNYGGRGIKVCEEWDNLNNFREWALNSGYREGLTIDRINVNGNYEPNNCRWVSMKVQQNNRRNNHYITYRGETHTLMEWSEITGINYDCLKTRINTLKWSIEKALTTPSGRR